MDSMTREIVAIYLKTIVEQEQLSAVARQYVNGDISIDGAFDAIRGTVNGLDEAVYAIVDGEGGHD